MFGPIFQLYAINFTAFDWAVILLPVFALSAFIMWLPGFIKSLGRLALPRIDASVLFADATGAPRETPRLSEELQWERVTQVLNASVRRATKAQDSHAVAGRQLDVADYELARIFDELRPLITGLESSAEIIESGAGSKLRALSKATDGTSESWTSADQGVLEPAAA